MSFGSAAEDVASTTPTHRGAPIMRRLGRYDLLAKIASGGMATVHLGRVRGVGGFERPVAIKVCHEHLLDDPEFRTRFLDEARLAAQIRHPNVVSTLDVSDEGGLYLVMEYVEGGRVSDLVRALIARNEPMPESVAVRIAIDTLLGLHAAHTATGPGGEPLNVVHRDISPQNILVATDGVTRVVDFGIAKAEARAAITADNSVRGKAAYMAPEQVLQDEVTYRADLFSFGAVFWEMLAGKRLFQRDTRTATMEAVLRGPIPSIRAVRADVDPALDAIVARALSRDPAERFGSALELADAVEAVKAPASHRTVGALVASSLAKSIETNRAILRTRAPVAVAETPPEAKPKRSLWPFGVAVAVLAAIGIGTAVAIVAMQREPDPIAPARSPDRHPPVAAEAAMETPMENVAVEATAMEEETVAPTEEAEAASDERPAMSQSRRRRVRPRGEFRPPSI